MPNKLQSTLYYCDGGEEDEEELAKSGEPWLPLSTWLIRENPNVKKRTVRETWDLQAQRDVYRSEYNALWGDDELSCDVILSPTGPGAAPPLNSSKYWQYTAQWNLLDYPSLVFPVGFVAAFAEIWADSALTGHKC